MGVIGQYFDVIYLYVLGILMFLSWYFLRKSQYDERRSKRFLMKNMKRHFTNTTNLLRNEKHEKFLRKHLFPKWISSEHINLIRLGTIFFLLITVLFGFLNQRAYLDTMQLVTWGMIPILLLPKEKYPLHYVAKIVNKGRQNEVSYEIYQLYNDFKSTYQTMLNPPNTYYQVADMVPYYSYIRPTLEKMLPYLERKQKAEAWSLFSSELNIEEAKILGVMMQEVESLSREQAVELLEQKRSEFSNQLFNRYADVLKRRKSIIFTLVVLGAITVFMNEFTVFFMWYREVMSVVNQFS